MDDFLKRVKAVVSADPDVFTRWGTVTRTTWARAFKLAVTLVAGRTEPPERTTRYARSSASTVLAYPEVAASVLGLDLDVVCALLRTRACTFTEEELRLVMRLPFREFWRRRGNPGKARAELLELARLRKQHRRAPA